MSTRSPARRPGRRTWSARIFSARPTSCGCWKSSAALPARRMRSPPRWRSARRLGKVPAVVGVCYGFVGNRMLARRSVEAERLLLEGALPQQVEAALVEFGLPMGPFAMMDLAGLDVGWLIRKIARRACRDRGCAVRGRAFRPEDRQRLFPLRGRLARPDPRSRGRAASFSTPRPGSASPAARSRRRRSSSARSFR